MKIKVENKMVKRGELARVISSRLAVPIGMLSAALIAGCGGSKSVEAETTDVLLEAGDTRLTLQDVVKHIPVGLEPQDSAAMFRNIVESWIKTEVLSKLASGQLSDMEEIDRKVESYRNRLIVAEYLREMRNGKDFNVSEDSILDFYNSHRREMLTEVPLVKGIYIKLPSDSHGINNVRELVFDGAEECIDMLEKNWLGDAVLYDYFMSDWIDWQSVADQIPYRFHDPDAFLKCNKNFETTHEGMTHILHIREFLPTGSIKPLDFAASEITEILSKRKISSYEDALVKSLVTKALQDGTLTMKGYNPLSHTLTVSSGLHRQ